MLLNRGGEIISKTIEIAFDCDELIWTLSELDATHRSSTLEKEIHVQFSEWYYALGSQADWREGKYMYSTRVVLLRCEEKNILKFTTSDFFLDHGYDAQC